MLRTRRLKNLIRGHFTCRKRCKTRKERARTLHRLRPAQIEVLEDRTLLAAIELLGVPTWLEQGPIGINDGGATVAGGLVSGAIQAVAVNRFDSTEVYAGTVNGGVWRTRNANDADVHWEPLTDQFPSLSVSTLTFSADDPDRVYAGTGTTSSFSRTGNAGGILSINGETGQATLLGGDTFGGVNITSIVSDLHAVGEVIVVSTQNDFVNFDDAAGWVWLSADGGQTFLPADVQGFDGLDNDGDGLVDDVTEGLPLKPISDLIADPTNTPVSTEEIYYAAVPGFGVFRGTYVSGNLEDPFDDTIEFTQILGYDWNGILVNPNVFGEAPDLLQSSNIKLAAQIDGGSTILYAGIVNGEYGFDGQLAGVLRSDDGGETWVSLPDIPDIHPGAQGDLHFSFAASPFEPGAVYVGGDSHPDLDGGNLFRWGPRFGWESIVFEGANGTAPHADSRAMVFDRGDLLQADDGGLFRLTSVDDVGNRRWSSMNGNLGVTEQLSVAYDPLNDVLLSGNQDNGVTEQPTADSAAWVEIFGGDGGVQQVVRQGSGSVRYSILNDFSTFHRRTFNSENELQADADVRLARPGGARLSGLQPLDRGIDFAAAIPFALNANDPSRMLIGYFGLYETREHGDLIRRRDVLQVDDIEASDGFVTALSYGGWETDSEGARHPQPDVVYAARRDTLYMRQPGGELLERQPADGGIRANLIRDLVVDPDDWRTAYVVDDTNVWFTRDAGLNWRRISGNLGDTGRREPGLRTIALAKTGADDTLRHVVLVGGFEGVYRAIAPADPAADEWIWTEFGLGLPNVPVMDLRYYDADGGRLFAATLGRGTWSIDAVNSQLGQAGELRITLEPGETAIKLARSADNPLLLDVAFSDIYSGGDFVPLDLGRPSVPLASFQQIVVYGGPESDALVVDSTHGPLSLPGGIHYVGGGGGDDQLQLQNDGEIEDELILNERDDAEPTGAVATSRTFLGENKVQVVYTDDVDQQRIADGANIGQLDILDSLRTGLERATTLTSAGMFGIDLPVLGDSLGVALDGVRIVEPNRRSDAVRLSAQIQRSIGGGRDTLFRRMFELGDNALPLGDIGTEIDTLTSTEALGNSLVERLDALDAIPGNVVLNPSGTPADVTLLDVSIVDKPISGTAELDVDVQTSDTTRETLRLAGLANITALVTMRMTFGVDGQGFFIAPDRTESPEFAIHDVQVTGDFAANGRIGMLDVELIDAELSVHDDLAISADLHGVGLRGEDGLIRVVDPDAITAGAVTDGARGDLDLGESLYTTVITAPGVGNDITLTGKYDIVSITDGREDGLSELDGAWVRYDWPDVVDAPDRVELTPESPDGVHDSKGETLLRFRDTTIADLIAGLNILGVQLRAAGGIDGLDSPIPFVDFSLGNLFFTEADPFVIDGDLGTAIEVSEVRSEAGFGKFDVIVEGENLAAYGVAAGDRVRYAASDGTWAEGTVDDVDFGLMTVRVVHDKGPRRADPTFEVFRPAGIDRQVTALLEPLDTLAGDGQSLQDLIRGLADLLGVGTDELPVQLVGDFSPAVEFSLHIDAPAIQTGLPIDFSSMIPGLSLESAESFDVLIDPFLSLTVGVELATASDVPLVDRFYVREGSEVRLHAEAEWNLERLRGSLGFLDVALTSPDGNPSLRFVADASAELSVASGAGGRIRLRELSAVRSDPADPDAPPPYDPLQRLTLRDRQLNVTTNIVIQADVGDTSAFPPVTVTLDRNIASAADIAALEAEIADRLSEFARFENISPETVLDAIPLLVDQLRRMGGGALETRLPLVDSSWSDILRAGKRMAEILGNPVDAFSTASAVEEYLNDQLADRGLSVQVVVTPEEILFTVPVSEVVDDNLPITFGLGDGYALVDTSGGGNLQVSGSVTGQLTFGVSTAPDLPSLDRVFIADGSTHFTLTADANAGYAPNEDGAMVFEVSLITADASVPGARGRFDVEAGLGLTEPAGADGRLTLRELTSGGFSVDTNASGVIQAFIPLDAGSGGFSGVGAENVFDPGSLAPDEAAIEVLGRFENLANITFDASPSGAFHGGVMVPLSAAEIDTLAGDQIVVQAHNLEGFLAGSLLDFSGLVGGFEEIADLAGRLLDLDILDFEIPFLDANLRDALNFVDSSFLPSLEDLLSIFRNEDLTAGGVKDAAYKVADELLKIDGVVRIDDDPTTSDDDPTSRDEILTITPDETAYRFRYRPHIFKPLGIEFDTDLGFLHLNARDLNLNFIGSLDLALGFGVDETGFFMETFDGPELALTGNLVLETLHDGATPSLSLGVVSLATSFDPADKATLTFAADVGAEGVRLRPGQLISSRLLDSTDVSLTFKADFTLPLDAKIEEKTLIHADLVVDWAEFDVTEAFTEPSVELNNVWLDVGTLIPRVFKNLLTEIDAHNPLSPILDDLNDPLPVVGLSILDLIGRGTELDKNVLYALVVDGLSTVQELTEGIVHVEEFGNTTLTRDGHTVPEDANGSDEDIPGADIPEIGHRLVELHDKLYVTFPILNFSSVVDLLLGRDVDIILFDPPVFRQEIYGLETEFGGAPYGIPGVAEVTVGGGFHAGTFFEIDVDLGLSTRGVRKGGWDNILAGLWIGDHTPGTNDDKLEVRVRTGVGAHIRTTGSLLGFDVVDVRGSGNISFDVGIDLNDESERFDDNPDDDLADRTDGRLHLDEILDIIEIHEDGPFGGAFCIFNLKGELSANLNLTASVDLWFDDFDIVDVNWGTSKSIELACAPTLPKLAIKEGRTLHLTSTNGRDDHARDFFAASDHPAGDQIEIFTVDIEGVPHIRIKKGAYSEDFMASDVDRITTTPPALAAGDSRREFFARDSDGNLQRDLGEGPDRVTVAKEVKAVVELHGGPGDDELQVAGGPPIFEGRVQLGGVLIGGEGNDSLNVAAGLSNWYWLIGGAGNDTLIGGPNGDRLVGDFHGNFPVEVQLPGQTAGADTISGGGGADLIWGDNKGVSETEDGPAPDGSQALMGDEINTGVGHSTVFAGPGHDIVIVALNGNAMVYGGSGNDTLTGGELNDILVGDAGDDKISGMGGDDELYGGPLPDPPESRRPTHWDTGETFGRDTLYGNEGNDLLNGIDSEFVVAHGHEGNDTVLGGIGNDRLYGNDGDDRLAGGPGADLIRGGADNDGILGGAGWIDGELVWDSVTQSNTRIDRADRLFGDDGDDVIIGDDGVIRDIDEGVIDVPAKYRDEFSTITTTSVVVRGGGADLIVGGKGNDQIIGATGGDIVFGDSDYIYFLGLPPTVIPPASPGDDIIIGDEGQIVSYRYQRQWPGPPARLETRDEFSVVATQSAFEPGDDVISGDELYVEYPGGNDLVFGGEGSDTIRLSTGDDIAFGDLAEYFKSVATVQIVDGELESLTTERYVVSQEAGLGARDMLEGGPGADILVGGAGSDAVGGGAQNDYLIGDHARIDFAPSGLLSSLTPVFPETGGADTLGGNGGDDILIGGFGRDVVNGNAGDDYAIGDHATVSFFDTGQPQLIESAYPDLGDEDTIRGGLDNDVLVGGALDDEVHGGDGQDIVFGDYADLHLDVDALGRFHSSYTSVGGNDKVGGGPGVDVVLGGIGDDRVYAGVGTDRDVLFGDVGRVLLYEGGDISVVPYLNYEGLVWNVGGQDQLHGGDGDEVIVAGPGRDTAYGGGGDDWIYGDLAEVHGFNIELYAQTTTVVLPDEGDQDFLHGQEGNDFIDAGAGNDFLSGGHGSNTLLGAVGEDTVVEQDDVDFDLYPVNLYFGDAVDGLESIEKAHLTGGDSANQIIAANFPGTTTLIGGDGNDELVGGINVDWMLGGNGADTLYGLAGDDLLIGGDTLEEYASDDEGDELHGMEGDDILLGQLGNDLLDGGFGHDQIDGGEGDDIHWALTGTGIVPEGTYHTCTVDNSSDAGEGSLRWAIECAEAVERDVLAVVDFQLLPSDPEFQDVDATADGDAEPDVFRLAPLAETPPLARGAVVVNGFSQNVFLSHFYPAYTDANATGPEIVLDGRDTLGRGLLLTSDDNGVYGLNIQQFLGSGVHVLGDRNKVSGNYIGTDATGSLDRGNRGIGVFVINASGNRIEKNLVSGNDINGIVLAGPMATNNTVWLNRVGTDRTASFAIGNTLGIHVADAPNNIVEFNTVSGNRVGVDISGLNAVGNVIRGNRIGATFDAVVTIGNRADGVLIDGAPGNTVVGNLIVGNETRGIAVRGDDATGNRIRANLIHSNLGLGIDLGIDGVTANDPMDLDEGPNGYQNFPVILSASAGEHTRVTGRLHSTPNTVFDLEFFANTEVDPSGYGEGERYLGPVRVTTDESGDATFDAMLIASSLPTEWITARATAALSGGTSEFSAAFAIRDYLVTNTNDSGPGSLRDAIARANSLGGADPAVISFAIPPTDPGYVDVDAHLPGGDADPDVFVIHPLTQLPALTRGNTVINGQSQQNETVTEQTGAAFQFTGRITSVDAALDDSFAIDAHLTVNVEFDPTFLDTDADPNHGQYFSVPPDPADFGAISQLTATIDGYAIQSADGVIQVFNDFENQAGLTLDGFNLGATVIHGLTGLSLGDYDLQAIDVNLVDFTHTAFSDDLLKTSLDVTAFPNPALRQFNLLFRAGDAFATVRGEITGIENVSGSASEATTALGDSNPFGPEIVLEGSSVGITGLRLDSDDNTVQGLVIHSFAGNGVVVTGDRNTVMGNYVGTDPTGTVDRGNGGIGVFVIDAAQNTIADNLISGNDVNGVVLSGSLATGNTVSNNRIGTNADGTAAIGNSFGVHIFGAPGNTVEDNVISGNQVGIVIGQPTATGNAIRTNRIGTTADGMGPLGNVANGIDINGAPGNTIVDNLISSNDTGVRIRGAQSVGNTIRQNSIYSNAGLGIDLGGDGVTRNDLRDPDTGPNDLQNIPVIGFAQSGSTTRVAGVLNSSPSSSFTLDFYAISEPDPSGHGEGERWLGSGIVRTDANGNGSYEFVLDAPTQSTEWITATATNANGSTSEFSQRRMDDAPANTLVVTNTNDSGLGSLRDAIVAANQIVATDPVEVWFRIPNSDTGFVDTDSHLPGGDPLADVFVITPQTALPAITRGKVSINATSQYFQSGNSNIFGPEVVLNGEVVASDAHGLHLDSNGNRVMGLVIQGFGSDGVYITGNENEIYGNYIGTTATGMDALGNAGSGIYLASANGTQIGDAGYIRTQSRDFPARNIISGNLEDGITVRDGAGNSIQGNFVGTASDGLSALGNNSGQVWPYGAGIWVDDSANNLIGGAESGTGNVISGNIVGLTIVGPQAANNRALGNYVGLGADGQTPVGNLRGISVLGSWGTTLGASGTQIGGTNEGERNVVSANTYENIQLNKTLGTIVQGNFIGTDETGTHSPVYGQVGIRVVDDHDSVIGGVVEGAGNVISGSYYGISINGRWIEGGTQRARVQGNLIGTSADGQNPLPNFQGIYVDGYEDETQRFEAHDVTIGGVTPGAANVISHNQNGGVIVQGPNVTGITIQGNKIGTDIDGVDSLPNGPGVLIRDASGVIVGGTESGAGNLISGNNRDGISITGGGTHIIQGNYIGTTADGMTGLGNAGFGIRFEDSSGNLLGGDTPGAGNVIAANANAGVYFNNGSSGSIVAGNYIGVGADGATDLGNFDGVLLRLATDIQIGGTTPGAGNVISGNARYGIGVGASSDTTIQGNLIGIDHSGEIAVGNGLAGVELIGGAFNTLIGGDSPTAGNLISGNPYGIRVSGSGGTEHTRIEGNRIGTNASGHGAVPNQTGIQVLATGGSIVRDVTIGGAQPGSGNVVSGNTKQGIHITGTAPDEQVFIKGNLIGTDIDGVDAIANGTGVLLEDSTAILIGGPDNAARNIISGNTGSGISITGGSDNTIQGNYIGTTASGDGPLANRAGIEMLDSNANIIGGASPGARNVISGNAVVGIQLRGSSSDNTIQGNYIGTDATGANAVGNENAGIDIIVDASRNLIGTDGDGMNDQSEGNLISGNGGYGIQLRGLNSGIPADNVIAGNFIGVDASGNNPLRNRGGILLWGTSDTRVGTNSDGTSDGTEQNIIAANGDPNVEIPNGIAGDFGIYMTENEDVVIAGNHIGVGADGLTSLGNVADGIAVLESPHTVVGGDIPAARNVIAANGRYGIALRRSSDSRISGNFIGVAANGTTANGNSAQGVFLADSANVIVGGTLDAERNVISGNAGSAILVSGSTSTNNTVQGNYIGTDASGSQNIGNGGWNVVVQGASNNLIGGDTPGAGNVIAGGGGYGVIVLGSTATGNTVQGNRIGTDASGLVAFSNHIGLSIQDASGNTVDGNLISGNSERGVYISGPTGTGNRFVNNSIGLGSDGTTPIPNGTGVYISGATGNTIGTPGEGNTIAHNASGVVVVGAAAAGNTIRGNSIHSNGALGIDLAGDGVTPNDPLDADSGPNELQNFPELRAVRAGATTLVVGTFDGTPDTTFTVDFYASDAADPTGYGEGQRWLGSIVVQTNGQGFASFRDELPGATEGGDLVTATATDPAGNTSEFSGAFMATGRRGGRLIVGGGNQNDVVNLSQGSVIVEINGEVFTFPDDGSLEVEVNLLAGNDTLISTIANNTTADGGEGDDYLQLGSGNDQAFGGPGNDTLLLGAGDDSAAAGAEVTHVYTATGTYPAEVTVVDSQGNETRITREVPITETAMQMDPQDPTLTALAVGGTTAGDRILIHKQGNQGQVKVQLDGKSLGTFAPTGRLLVYGQAGNDKIDVAGSVWLASWLFGGDGDDHMNGGNGPNVLMGGKGDDMLIGGSGRDLLDGGLGADVLVGNGGDDLLIGGRLAFDQFEAALAAIMAEWTSSRSYEARVANLRGDETSPSFDDRANSDVFLTVDGDSPTVRDDGARDRMTGSAGRDWFFANLDDDLLTDRKSGKNLAELLSEL